MSVDVLHGCFSQEQLLRLLQEARRQTRQECSAGELFAQLLPTVTQALAAVAGAVWQERDGSLTKRCEVGWLATGIDSSPASQDCHHGLLLDALTRGQALLCAPCADLDEIGERANPTPFRILVVPLRVRRDIVGLIELFQRPELDPSVQRGHLQLLVEVSNLVNQFLADRKLDEYARQEDLWTRWAGFTQCVSAGLNSHDTAAVIANEGRRLIGCDRLTLALRHGRRPRVTAISGQETFDRRAAAVRLLEQLAGAVLAGSEPLWYTGEMDGLPPQIRTPLEAYLDVAPMQTVAVLPLFRPRPGDHAVIEEPIGALIVECIEREGTNIEALRDRAVAVRDVAGPALANCLEHERLFLLPVWRALGNATRLTERRTLSKTMAVVGLILLAVGLLTLVPADFELEGRGTLQPVERRDVFAEIDGDIQRVHVQHGAVVQPGDLLAELRNVDLEVKVEDLKGERNATFERLSSVETALFNKDELSDTELNRLHGERLVHRQALTSIDRQQELLAHKRRQLDVRSPIAGEVVTWNVADVLLHRPVKRGDVLLSIAQPAGEWELEVRMPEDHMGHIHQALANGGGTLPVRYVAANHPGQTLPGVLREVHGRAEVHGEEGNTVLLRVTIDKRQVADLRPGAEVSARVDCGRRALGYVWLHDLFAFVQSKILFRWF